MSRTRVVAVTGDACLDEVVSGLAREGAVVVVWSADAARCGALVRQVTDAGGRGASLVAPPSARDVLVTFATEQFGGLDEVLGAAAVDG